jgi:hypothetical protein
MSVEGLYFVFVGGGEQVAMGAYLRIRRRSSRGRERSVGAGWVAAMAPLPFSLARC